MKKGIFAEITFSSKSMNEHMTITAIGCILQAMLRKKSKFIKSISISEDRTIFFDGKRLKNFYLDDEKK
jgi:hypothetical protein